MPAELDTEPDTEPDAELNTEPDAEAGDSAAGDSAAGDRWSVVPPGATDGAVRPSSNTAPADWFAASDGVALAMTFHLPRRI